MTNLRIKFGGSFGIPIGLQKMSKQFGKRKGESTW